jgi:hypothetical protein
VGGRKWGNLMLVIPTQPLAAQSLAVVLGGQACRITMAQKSTGLFLDLYVNDTPIIGGVLCLVGVKIVRDAYLGFTGDLAVFDTRPDGTAQVTSDGLGGRYFLAYLP